VAGSGSAQGKNELFTAWMRIHIQAVVISSGSGWSFDRTPIMNGLCALYSTFSIEAES